MKTIYVTELDLEDLAKCGVGSCYAHPLTGQIGTVAYVRVEDAAQMARDADLPHSDAIERSKRILAMVDIYHECPDRMNRNALRGALMDEFTELNDDADQAASTRADNWQPIEMAPTDAGPLLLFARYIHASAPVITVGHYYDSIWINTTFGGAAIQQIVPSHWMPLPPFPGQHKNIV